jgi:hypothetical protein
MMPECMGWRLCSWWSLWSSTQQDSDDHSASDCLCNVLHVHEEEGWAWRPREEELEAHWRERRARAERRRWREKREGERDIWFRQGRMISEASIGAVWNLHGRCGCDRKLPGKALGCMDPTCRRQHFAPSHYALALRSNGWHFLADVDRLSSRLATVL